MNTANLKAAVIKTDDEHPEGIYLACPHCGKPIAGYVETVETGLVKLNSEKSISVKTYDDFEGLKAGRGDPAGLTCSGCERLSALPAGFTIDFE